MEEERTAQSVRRLEAIALRTAITYGTVGGLWILFSDRLLSLAVTEQSRLLLMQTYKGWAFVLATAILLYWLVARDTRNLRRSYRALAAEERSVSRLNRIYRVLSGINGAILRIRERDQLLEEACRIAVEEGGFRLAWIGLLDDASQVISPTASFGPAVAYLDGFTLPLNPNAQEAQGPTAKAIREKRHFVANDIERDPFMTPWREKARRFGFRSSIALPLIFNDKILGSFNLYSEVAHFFDDLELKLVLEVAADTALGLGYIEQEQTIQQLAHFDLVTGLPNRFLLDDRLAHSLMRAKHANRCVGVGVMDIEGFKKINDTQGRGAGDAVLQQSAEILKRLVREGDTVAHLGGDEFAIVFNDVAKAEDIGSVADKILRRFRRYLVNDGREIFLAGRMGIAIYPNDGLETETLIKNAELALHSRNVSEPVVFYEPRLNTIALEHRDIEEELRHALERDELSLVYQPVFNTHAQCILGVEALLRWSNQKLGAVSPAQFIPVAEETGLIEPIGEWVLATACRQSLSWAARGIAGIRVAVNVSVRQLHNPSFVERVEEILSLEGFDPQVLPLALEITESELMRDPEHSKQKLMRLKELGIKIYVDDFGTGHSSLSYLTDLPIDVLKVDRSFVSAAATTNTARSVVQAIAGLAQGLDLQVIAEGVETHEQLEVLKELGCHAVQGFLLGRPMAAEQVEELLVCRN